MGTMVPILCVSAGSRLYLGAKGKQRGNCHGTLGEFLSKPSCLLQ